MSLTDSVVEINKNVYISNDVISDIEKDTLGEIGNISMGTAATALYEMVGKRVEITAPKVSLVNLQDFLESYEIPFVIVEVKFIEGLEGYSILVMKKQDVMILTDMVMGGDGTSSEGELDELRLSAMGEIMNQMIGSSATSLSDILNKTVNIEPPNVIEGDAYNLQDGDREQAYVKISFKMVIEDLVNSELMQLMPIDFAKKLVSGLLNHTSSEAPAEEVSGPSVKGTQSRKQKNNPGKAEKHKSEERIMQDKHTEPVRKQVNIKPLDIPSFDEEEKSGRLGESKNMDLLLDVPLPVSVELGRSKKVIKEILELHEGSIVVLDKLAGDLVDVVVNGKLIAKGEVVIIDDNYGVRITELAEYSKGDLG
jgi:flagellar motor switch protein FliN/FliY